MESGDRDILQNMKKGYSARRIVESIEAAKEMGILTHVKWIKDFNTRDEGG